MIEWLLNLMQFKAKPQMQVQKNEWPNVEAIRFEFNRRRLKILHDPRLNAVIKKEAFRILSKQEAKELVLFDDITPGVDNTQKNHMDKIIDAQYQQIRRQFEDCNAATLRDRRN
ncbi:MAG: hypothetical protein RBS24_06045 [Bacilli bacterium]|nr:hypothetical protein [Bacilli bacterium]